MAQQLEMRAESIAEHLTARKLATQAEIDACYTEGEEPDLKIALAYAALRVILSERSPDNHDKKSRRSKADRVILDALRGEAKPITLSEPVGDVRDLAVYPKSLNALIELAERDAVIGFYSAGLDALRKVMAEYPTPERAEMLARAVREIAYQQQLCVWIVTHASPGLPYPVATTTPELPAWLGELSPVDVLFVFRAHEEVNAGRLAALQALPRGKHKADEQERGWGVYLANLATLLNRSAEQLSADHSLAALFAQSYVHAVDQERAMEEAERK